LTHGEESYCTVSDKSPAHKQKIEFRIVWQSFVGQLSKVIWKFTALLPDYS